MLRGTKFVMRPVWVGSQHARVNAPAMEARNAVTMVRGGKYDETCGRGEQQQLQMGVLNGAGCKTVVCKGVFGVLGSVYGVWSRRTLRTKPAGYEIGSDSRTPALLAALGKL